uniref:Uncharacterized protein n=1 Tax=Cyprinus carpio carpio TaxID=630221 RepID=A0A9J8A8K3_CYPCA
AVFGAARVGGCGEADSGPRAEAGPAERVESHAGRPWATTSPPPVFEISTWNRFSPLRETERDAVIVGDSIVRHVCATLAEVKVHTHCFPGPHVSAQIPAILKADESPRAVVLHARVNDTTQRQTDTEEGLQEPDRDGSQHDAPGDDHRVRTTAHVSTRTQGFTQAPVWIQNT